MILHNTQVSKKISLVMGIVLIVAFLLPVLIPNIDKIGELKWEFPFLNTDGLEFTEQLYLFLPLIAGILLIVLSFIEIPKIEVGSGMLNFNAILKIALITVPVFLVADKMIALFDYTIPFDAAYNNTIGEEVNQSVLMSHGIVFLCFMLILIVGMNMVRDIKSDWVFFVPAAGGLFFFMYMFLPVGEDSVTILALFDLLDKAADMKLHYDLTGVIVQFIFFVFLLAVFVLQFVNIGLKDRSDKWVRGNFLTLYLGIGLFLVLMEIIGLAALGDVGGDFTGKVLLITFTLYLKSVVVVVPLLLAAAMGPVEIIQGLLRTEEAD